VKTGTRLTIRADCPMDVDYVQRAGPKLALGSRRTFAGSARVIVFRREGVGKPRSWIQDYLDGQVDGHICLQYHRRMTNLGSEVDVWLLDEPDEREGTIAVLTTAELAECTCPEFCERDHEVD
jgi:hypothetical protein